MPSDKKILISKKESGQRLDIFLSEKLEISRSQAQKLIEEDLVLVNGKLPKKAGDILKTDCEVTIGNYKATVVRSPSTVVGRTRTTDYGLQQMTVEPKIITETKDYLVIEKPTGLLTHPTLAEEPYSLSGWLSRKFPEVKKVGDDPKIRPGIVHRLDKEASGLLVVARTQKMFEHLKKQFKERMIEKEYYALVHGKVAKDWDVLNFPIARSETMDRMAARPLRKDENDKIDENDGNEKEAKTEFFVERRFVNFTLLRVILHTGRMHQIRVHMLAYNHPLVGDPLYLQKKRDRKWDEKLGRLFLHSTKLSFIDLEGIKKTFESPLPEELSNFLNTLS